MDREARMRLHRNWRVSILALLLLGISGTDVFAQVPTGTIEGTVKDSQGLSVPGATVTLTNEGTAKTQTDTTSSRGAFQFTHLNVGVFKVEVSKTGFKISVVNGIKLDASTEYSVPPIALEVGPVTETVTIESDANVVRTAGAEITDTVERKQIEELPILDRNPMNLLELQAGVSQTRHAFGSFLTVINGQRQSFSNMALDGINIQDNYVRSESLDYTPNLLFMSQVGEFTTTTQNAGPQAGLGSSQVSMVTPSGTNNWHGEGFWYYKTGAWAANDWFNDANGVAKPNLLQNQAGGDVGGPVIKDKLFVYGAYELYRLRRQSPVSTTVLSASARNGIFQWRDSTSNTLRCARVVVIPGITAPGGCADLTNNNAPSIDPVIASMLSRVPSTINNQSVGDGLNTGGYSFNQRDNETRDNTSVRLDWVPATHHSLSGTYAWNHDMFDRPGSGLSVQNTYDPVPSVHNDDKADFLSTAWRWSPTSNFTNEVRFGFNLAPINFVTNQKFGLFTLDGALFNNPDQNSFPSSRKVNTWSWQDNASWARGNHTLSSGVQLQRTTIFAQNYANTLPDLTIGDAFSNSALVSGRFAGGISDADLATANALLSSLAGIISQEQQTFNVTSQTSGYVPRAASTQNFHYNYWSLYGGDSWRMRANLTFTYGLRWEYYSPFDERDGLLVLPVFPPGQTIQQTMLSDATLNYFGGNSGRRTYAKDLNNFAPNIGIAWDPFADGKTSIRAGYSINYVNDEIVSAPYSAALDNPGLSTLAGNFNLDTTISSPSRPSISVPPVSIPSTFSQNLANLGGFPGGNFSEAIDPNLRTPYVQQWNLSVQREIGWNTSLTVSYVGNKGTKLYRAIDLNQVNIGSNGFLNDFIKARSNGFLALAANPSGGFDPSYNKNIAGSQPLPIFDNNLLFGGLLSVAAVQSLIQQGEVGELANYYHSYGSVYQQNTNGPTLQLTPNPLLQTADILGNYSGSTYHAGSVEIRRRFRRGLNFQGNYTFSKVFTDYSADTINDQIRFLPYLDNAQPGLERARANFDLTHAFKANFRCELPFGKGHAWAPSNNFLSQLASGWTMSSIITWQSGAPFSIMSGRGTLNRVAFRSAASNTASTTSTPQQIAGQLGVYRQLNGQVLLINPKFVGSDGRGAPSDAMTCTPLVPGGFCNPDPGTVGNLPRNAFNGPAFFDWDVGIHKSFPITESKKLEYRVEMFNAPNHPTFATGNFAYSAGISGANASDMYINDPNFGVATSLASSPRVIQMGLRFLF
jgi:Carboxypeptidase regulatory-like domain/TonB dependent receptor